MKLCKCFSKKEFSEEEFNHILSVKYEIRGTSNFWTFFKQKSNRGHIAWKIHIYADDKDDFLKMSGVILPILNKYDINHKLISKLNNIISLNSDNMQKGKVITLYPASIKEFQKVSQKISTAIQKNDLCLPKSTTIIGDKPLGNTGRIFYRFELKRNQLLSDDKEQFQRQKEQYPNLQNITEFSRAVFKTYPEQRLCTKDGLYRTNDGKYLASDMTGNDDIFRNFNPDNKLSSWKFW